MEMTGLDPLTHTPIELAAVVTDLKFQTVETYQTAIFQPQSELDKMDDWNQKHHSESGLLDLIPNGKPLKQVDIELSQLIDRHFQNERPILCGNSIAQDRSFIKAHFPIIESKLHYRMLDVSSWKVVFQALYNQKYEKQNAHRALDDIKESIRELQHYLTFIKL